MEHGLRTEEQGKAASRTLLHEQITEQVIGAAFEVHSVLGHGFPERVYPRAMQAELLRRGIACEIEHRINVLYKGINVGDYAADLLVDGKVVVELKVSVDYNPLDEAQLLNELRATGMKVGLLINFGRTKVEFRRLVF